MALKKNVTVVKRGIAHFIKKKIMEFDLSIVIQEETNVDIPHYCLYVRILMKFCRKELEFKDNFLPV